MPIRNRKRPGGGAAPFGYRWQGDVLVPHPEEAPVRRRIYELFLEQRNQRTVARLLNEMGYRTRRGAKFSITTVGRLLRDPLAKGHRLANVTVSVGMKKHRKLKPNSKRAISTVQPIVSEDLWNEANRILYAKRTATQTAKPQQLFAGLTFCACGRQMSAISKSDSYFCKKCRNRISMVDLDRAFQEQLRAVVFRKEKVARTPGPTDATIKAKKERLHTLSQEKARVSKELDRVYQAFSDNWISEPSFRCAYRPLNARLKRLEQEIADLFGELDRLGDQGLPRDEMLSEGRELYTDWQTIGQDEKRRSIQTLVKRITVGRDNVRIDTW